MEYLKPKIEFYRQRTFSEKMNVIFAFIRENWRPLLKYSFFLIMPVCLVQAFAMNSLLATSFNAGFNAATFDDPFGSSMASFIGSYIAMMFCALIGTAIISGLIYAMMQTYAERENRLLDVTLNDFKGLFIQNVWKYFRLIVALVFVLILFVVFMALLAAYVSLWSLGITIPLLFFLLLCLIPLSLVFPVYVFERDITFLNAFRKAWKLGYPTLGGLIGLMIILYFISMAIQTITTLPWYITTIAGLVFSVTTESGDQSVTYKFILYILGLIQSYGAYVSSIIGIIGIA